MKNHFLIFLFFSNSFLFSQQTVLELKKTPLSDFILDGTLSEAELENAKILEVLYESEPGLNTMPSQETTGYLTYTDKFLYLGVKATRKKVTAPLTPRDNRAVWRGDFAGLVIDTYGDARNNILLVSNASGSQNDVIRLPGESSWGPNIKDVNFDFKSSGRITDRGYEIEFMIPYSELPFPNGQNQSWKVELFTGYIDDDLSLIHI